MSSDPKTAQENNVVQFLSHEEDRVRVEIDELCEDNEMTNLLLLALEEMQKEPTKDQLSKSGGGKENWWTYWALGSIHGMPSEPWDKVKNKLGGNSYCPHSQIYFPTWHRVYIGMFEQAVSNKVNEIAQLFTGTERDTWISAARRFRLPYWDPLMPRNEAGPTDSSTSFRHEPLFGLPKILAAPTVFVRRPEVDSSGKPTGKILEDQQIDNPLFSFKFPSNDTLKSKGRATIDWNQLNYILKDNNVAQISETGKQQTVRAPGPDGKVHLDGDAGFNNRSPDEWQTRPDPRWGLQVRIQRQAKSFANKFWKLLAHYDPKAFPMKGDGHGWDNEKRQFSEFSNNGGRARRDQSISLESWHDGIHSLIGSGNGWAGHMGLTGIAGFEPMFWLHHNNIDRMFAIYQALYPDQWFPEGDDEVTMKELFPFRKSNKDNNVDYWRSNDVKDWKDLGFAVPGSKELNDQTRADIQKYLYKTYSWIIEDKDMPDTLAQHWPKKGLSSYALHGTKAQPRSKPHLTFQKISSAGLLDRSLALPTLQSPGVQIEDEKSAVLVEKTSIEAAPPMTLSVKNQTVSQTTWNARVRVKKFAFNGPFNVHVFIGHIKDEQPDRYITKKNEVGYSSVFANSQDNSCENCVQQREDGLIYEDAIPITPFLYDYLKTNESPHGPETSLRTLESFEAEHVVPFLKANMGWRVTDIMANLISNPEDLIASALEVRVSSRRFDLPTPDNPLGTYYAYEAHPEITSGQVGGAGFVA